MQEDNLFEYAVIRVVPAVEREEFLNVGVALFCAKQKFLKILYHLDEERLLSLNSKIDITEIKEYLSGFDHICEGDKNGGSIGRLPIAERFRWLTATRSTVVQTSKVHPGFCKDANEMLEKLYQQLVL